MCGVLQFSAIADHGLNSAEAAGRSGRTELPVPLHT